MGWVHRSAGAALTGFAHGTAGIMLALARLGHDAKEGRYLEAAYQAYRYEEHYYREEQQDWADLRDTGDASQEEPRMAWCHGWGGIVMTRVEAEKYVEGVFKEGRGRIGIMSEGRWAMAPIGGRRSRNRISACAMEGAGTRCCWGIWEKLGM